MKKIKLRNGSITINDEKNVPIYESVEAIFDKIRAEIDELDVLKYSSGERIYKDEVLDIIDKYKSEMENEE